MKYYTVNSMCVYLHMVDDPVAVDVRMQRPRWEVQLAHGPAGEQVNDLRGEQSGVRGCLGVVREERAVFCSGVGPEAIYTLAYFRVSAKVDLFTLGSTSI